MADYLRSRYSGKRIDLLVAVDPGVVRFLKAHGDEIYPGVPVVYYGVRDSTLRQIDPPSRFVGVPEQFDPAPTINLALALRPRRARSWRSRHRRARPGVGGAAARDLASRRGEDAPAHRREHGRDRARGRGAQVESVVVVASFRRDGRGRDLSGSTSVVERLRRVSAVPVFHL
jgi:hypothetical protein